ncbi:MAG: hypothetical protein U5L45_12045 [Saprospiraceae bacterium]|nr:hypothetical protein [Saprospiraceae bacterium]
MIIANPLYDVVFKYLLEDIDIARELLSTILGEDIVYLEVKPQETVTTSIDGSIRILRFDFKATIELPSGEQKKVLIELQKLKQSLDVMRFRRYLGDNYAKEDDVILDNGTQVKLPLPIVTIYILGFLLNHLKKAAVKINREYVDIFTGQVIENVRDEFVELLTHDSYVIQTRLLPPESKTKLERILQVFNPKFKTKDTHKLDFTGDANDLIVQKMLNRLQRAIADEEMRHQMNVEDEFERILAREAKRVSDEKDEIIAEKDQALFEKDQALSEKDQALSEKDQIIETERLKIEVLMKQLAELQQKMNK